ncbi:MAG TPA: DNA-directed RNA polymerase subunit alpha C-terminal domain-containing protein [Candidatus Saccharimonadales bacterium]|nr:DNA-directed RNA polymerase subunit alpha C-terminal domain-containing protein [Candidatus Saccharimonadales bacterium]
MPPSLVITPQGREMPTGRPSKPALPSRTSSGLPKLTLARTQIDALGELVEKTEDDLLAITNFGNKSLDQVKARLDELGLKLAGPG